MQNANNGIPLITRIAPSPNGPLHLGNILNILVVHRLAQKYSAKIALRIDDIDGDRCRPEYIEEIFECLKWLQIEWDIGPKNVQEFQQNWTQSLKIDYYRSKLQNFGDLLYGCDCSRKSIVKRWGDSRYRGHCRTKKLNFQKDVSCLRINTEEENIFEKMGDFVMWRKEDMPAYQLFSVIDDFELGVNLFIRGEDLYSSSLAQQFLMKKLSIDTDHHRHIFHPLVKNEKGEKLSKSLSAPSWRELDSPQQVWSLINQGLSTKFPTLEAFLEHLC